ncbi:hypothetical protein ASE48_08715 [Mycobacterium sp. Root265]|uniref:hypothetical protein n=1 Tax=Mycobacterium sp. Root265 TaxID=1736504 RepID=UPI00070A3F23|nr:hypothetical protein [Mycobacterium sp. Root265]KRD08632.1 hypothetical protein ASE48_08715 [Mycobacterium sp. Root265]
MPTPDGPEGTDDHQFFDILYQQFALTTDAKDAYWGVGFDPDEHLQWQVFSEGHEKGSERKWIGSFNHEVDADFAAGMHGALPDLIRRLHDAVDEAERMDTARDQAEGVAAEAVLENMGLQSQITELEREIAFLRGTG